MPFKRLTDYTGVTIWVLTLIFSLGVIYAQQLTNTKSIVDLKEKAVKIELIEKEISLFEMKLSHMEETKKQSDVTVKEFMDEMKKNNKAILAKLQSTDNNVLKTSFQLEAISNKLKIKSLTTPPLDAYSDDD